MRIHAFHHLYQQRLDRSTKPFVARGSKVVRCKYCQVAEKDCLCAHQPDVESGVSAMLLLSENEVFKPSNTGRLILDVVKDGYAYQWSRTEPSSEMLALLNNPKYQPIVVFPDEYVNEPARLIKQEASKFCEGKTPLLIFLDGSWREARRIFNKSPYLDALPVISINPDTVSQYMMRRSDNEQHLATAEVASLVFEQFGEVKLAQTLSSWFAVFRESYMNSKTRNRPDEAKPALNRFIDEVRNEKPI
ncbi:tRNA-uridine aminocarboxypropyltransferase [Vibrio europaeus]|uniref:tRNA-uridine aminocarboxypropyltransferase n=1 Tax=Vibrio europaeus TaxID=300876 RepID=UPI00148E5BD0|nr:tRNA-uridine aminocarboxypropyltransferase [Vibrio europaeus]NOH24826.1 DTW domain-containing protein [Vibrio europaeus]